MISSLVLWLALPPMKANSLKGSSMGDLDQPEVGRVIVLSMIVNDLAKGLIVFQDRQGVLPRS